MTTGKPIKLVQAMAGAPRGGAEAFYTRLVCALSDYSEVSQTALTRLFDAADVAFEPFRFGGPLNLLDHWRYRQALQRLSPDIVLTYMNRATRLTPSGPYRLTARLGHYYNLKHYRHCDYWVGNTQGICDHLIGGGMPAERVFHIANFIDETTAPPLARDTFDTPADVPILLALGRLHANKGFDTLFRAMPEIEKTRTNDGEQ